MSRLAHLLHAIARLRGVGRRIVVLELRMRGDEEQTSTLLEHYRVRPESDVVGIASELVVAIDRHQRAHVEATRAVGQMPRARYFVRFGCEDDVYAALHFDDEASQSSQPTGATV